MRLEAAIRNAEAESKGTDWAPTRAAEHRQLARWLKELQRRRRDDQYNKEFGPTSFHRLFYREHLGRVVQRLRTELSLSKKFKRYSRMPRRLGHFLTLGEVTEFLAQLVTRAEDDESCNDNCKSMYFCSLKRKHEGNHVEEESGLAWD